MSRNGGTDFHEFDEAAPTEEVHAEGTEIGPPLAAKTDGKEEHEGHRQA